MKTKMSVIGALAALVGLTVAVAGGYFWGRHGNGATSAPSPASRSAAREVLYWYDPMQPDKHFVRPGPSPFMPSMQLVPKYGGGESNEAGVRVSARVEQNLGMHTALVKRGVLRRELRVPGVFAWDRRRSVAVSARADGVLTRLFVRAPFDHVHARQPLAKLLSPEWN